MSLQAGRRANYSVTTTVSASASGMASKPPLNAQKATKAIVITTSTISTRLAERDVGPT